MTDLSDCVSLTQEFEQLTIFLEVCCSWKIECRSHRTPSSTLAHAAQPHEHQRGVFALRKAGVHGKEGNSDTSRTDPIRMPKKNGMAVSSREPWRDEGGCGAEALGASTALWAMVVEALLDGAQRGVRRRWLVWRQGAASDFRARTASFATMTRDHERLESWLLCVTQVKECAAAQTAPTLNL